MALHTARGYIPVFVTERKRSEAALIQVVQEAFVQGVSTRKVDALYEKVRVDGRIVSMAVLIVCGVNENGRRDIIAVEPMAEASRSSYGVLFQDLKDRGLLHPG